MPLLRSSRNCANTFWDTHLLWIPIIRASKRFCHRLSRLRNSNITSLSYWGMSTRSITSRALIMLLRMASLEARLFPLVYVMSFPCLISFLWISWDNRWQLVLLTIHYFYIFKLTLLLFLTIRCIMDWFYTKIIFCWISVMPSASSILMNTTVLQLVATWA